MNDKEVAQANISPPPRDLLKGTSTLTTNWSNNTVKAVFNDCCKTKPKQYSSQSQYTETVQWANQNLRQLHLAVGFASHWWRNWHEIVWPITERSNAKRRQTQFTFDSQMKTALEIMVRFKFLLKHGHSIISVENHLDIIPLFGFNFPSCSGSYFLEATFCVK